MEQQTEHNLRKVIYDFVTDILSEVTWKQYYS